MRWLVLFGLALPFVACRQTVVFDQTGSDGGAVGDSGPICLGETPVGFDLAIPEVIVALDRSAGMNTRFGDTSTPLAASRAALDQFATQYQKVVTFGLVEFPGTPTAPGSVVCSNSQQGGCCAGALSAPNINVQKFENALYACDLNPSSCSMLSSQRPAVPALTASYLYFTGLSTPSNRYVMLITNGQPDCGASQNSGCMDAQVLAGDLSAINVETKVIVPGQIDGPSDTSQCLQELAVAGGATNYPPYFRSASNPTDLSNTIESVIRDISHDVCVLNLRVRIQNSDNPVLYWKDQQVPRNGGWELLSNFELKLHGDWCDHLIKDGQKTDFTLYANCDPLHP